MFAIFLETAPIRPLFSARAGELAHGGFTLAQGLSYRRALTAGQGAALFLVGAGLEEERHVEHDEPLPRRRRLAQEGRAVGGHERMHNLRSARPSRGTDCLCLAKVLFRLELFASNAPRSPEEQQKMKGSAKQKIMAAEI